ncbi:hypothetical protein E2C01_089506 [Portunus trituberculatus]|uniref:Uncharacterized protein n=1 Tax=Portunus trituberculatus TaxID=210409 RepID=A0A5B7JDQ8_PORTR|nr:hypothetical protein [Portunus trituberculatus]
MIDVGTLPRPLEGRRADQKTNLVPRSAYMKTSKEEHRYVARQEMQWQASHVSDRRATRKSTAISWDSVLLMDFIP